MNNTMSSRLCKRTTNSQATMEESMIRCSVGRWVAAFRGVFFLDVLVAVNAGGGERGISTLSGRGMYLPILPTTLSSDSAYV